MGLYTVTAREIAVIGWSGSGRLLPALPGDAGAQRGGGCRQACRTGQWRLRRCRPPSAGRVRAAITGLLATAHRVGELGM